MIALTLAAGFALLLIQQALHELRKLASEPTGIDHATQVFPHPNETKQTYQKRKL
jgi:hypothetical protein